MISSKEPLNKGDHAFIQDELDRLKERVPHNSSIRISLENVNDVYKVKIDVKSLYKKFSTASSGSSLKSTVLKTISEIDRQLLDWKKKRFLDLQYNYNSHRLIGGF